MEGERSKRPAEQQNPCKRKQELTKQCNKTHHGEPPFFEVLLTHEWKRRIVWSDNDSNHPEGVCRGLGWDARHDDR